MRTGNVGTLLLSLTAVFGGAGSVSATELPVACAPGTCGAMGPGKFVMPGGGVATATPQGASKLLVTQTTDKAILNWSSFNIGAGGTVEFVQPTVNSVALNRIFQASPSRIFGALQANGQVYLINQNGVIFGGGAQVSTAGLMASSLALSDGVFAAGIASPSLLTTLPPTPALARVGHSNFVETLDGQPVLDADGAPIPVGVTVAPGATLTVAKGGRVLLAGQSVTNGGTIKAPDGQVILAAGESVYLQASTDPALRGLYVEVDAGGKAWNQLGGLIDTPRGDATLVGLAVNQDGRISATTSVAANGSVRLLARDTPQYSFNQNALQAQRGGVVELGEHSVTEVLPDAADTTVAFDAVAQLPSTVEITGRQIFIGGGSQIVAPGGALSVTAAANPNAPAAAVDPSVELRVDAGARIDLSGSQASASVTRNLVSVDLRANELKDSPLQRDGALRGTTVVVDARVGTPIADVSGAIAGIGRTVLERTAVGGSATLRSEGDLLVASGASLDVSGGQVDYTGGYMQTTKLVGADGSIVDIGSASPDKVYTGAISPTVTQTYNLWGVKQVVTGPTTGTYESGYTDGKAAGSLSFVAPVMVLDGTLLGHSVSGALQRAAATLVPGGTLTIGLASGSGPGAAGELLDFSSPSITFSNRGSGTSVADGTPLPYPQTLTLPVAAITSGGFTRSAIYSNGAITLPAGVPLTLEPGASLSLRAARVELDSNITAIGGTVDAASVLTAGTGTSLPAAGVFVGDGVALDVRGGWINDLVGGDGGAPTAALLQNGGSIRLAAPGDYGTLSVGDDTQLLASGGAWLDGSGTLHGGSGGGITLAASAVGASIGLGARSTLEAFGVNGANGGTFSLTAPRIAVVGGLAGWAPGQTVTPKGTGTPFFTVSDRIGADYGFKSVALNAQGSPLTAGGNALEVRSGANLAMTVATLGLDASYSTTASAANLAAIAQVTELPVGLRPVGSVSLSAVPAKTRAGLLEVAAGATVSTDPGGAVSLVGEGGVRIEGTLLAPAGAVSVLVSNPPLDTDPGYSLSLGIELSSGALIDVSGLTALTPNAQDLRLGSVLGGGSVRLQANRGSVRFDAGSTIAANGASGLLDLPSSDPSLPGYRRTLIGSDAGTVVLQAPESIVDAGNLSMHAGSGEIGRSRGGTLSIGLGRNLGWSVPPEPAISGTFPRTPRRLVLTGAPIDPTGALADGVALVSAPAIAQSGVDALTLVGGDVIEFRNAPTLNLGRSLVLQSGSLASGDGSPVTLSAAYVNLSSAVAAATASTASTGGGVLSVSASQIDLTGSMAWRGIGSASLSSTGDLRFISRGEIDNNGNSIYVGDLTVAGNLTLSAQQFYPTTDSTFTLAATGASSRITFAQAPGSSPVPLSAGGQLTVSAADIVQQGTLRAPFGSLTLSASHALTLAPGSLTSVSGAGLEVPFGRVSNGGKTWTYNNGVEFSRSVTTVPARVVTLNGPSVTVAKGATVDLSGGGDLYAAEWVPGTGGSKDVLAPGATSGLYAILPTVQGFAPYDPQEWTQAGLSVGASVYLAGAPGIAAGTYALLPARYALLPGAILVRAVSGYGDLSPSQPVVRPDGSVVVAGYSTFANSGIGGSRYTGFAVSPGSYANSLATYNGYQASTFLPSQAIRLNGPRADVPADAGRLVLSVTQALVTAGDIVATAAKGGRGAAIDVATPSLEIVHGDASASAPGVIALSDSTLERWHASSLLLGGERSIEGSSIRVTAGDVRLDAGATVVADDVTLVARNAVDVGEGSVLASTTGATPGAGPAPVTESTVALTGTGASGAVLVGVSDTTVRVATRPSGTVAAGTQVNVAPTARIASRGAVVFDATGGANLQGTVSGDGASWSVASSRILFGSASGPADPGALTIGPTLLAAFGNADAVRIAGHTSVGLVGANAVSIGSPALRSLTLASPVLLGSAQGADLSLVGRNVVLTGVAGAPAPAAVGAGQVRVDASRITLGDGAMSIAGFGGVALTATDQIQTTGTTAFNVGGDLRLVTPRLTGTSGSTATVNASGALALVSSAGTPADPLQLGASLTLAGKTVAIDSVIAAPSGVIDLIASQGVTLGAHSVLDVSGQHVAVVDRSVGSPGGTVIVAAGTTLTADAGSQIRADGVAGTHGEAATRAGAIHLGAGGAAALGGTVSAVAGQGPGGDFSLSAGSLADFGGLVSTLVAGGVSGDLAVRVDTGDLRLTAGQTLTGRSVALVTDTGAMAVDGVVVATGGAPSSGIHLYSGGDLNVSGQLRADGAAGVGGGDITIGSLGGTVRVDPGSRLSAHAGAGDGLRAGDLTVRASASGPALAGQADPFQLASLPADLSGFDRVALVPVLAPFVVAAQPDSAALGAIQDQAASFADLYGAAIAQRLNPTAASSTETRIGVDLVSAGNLTIGALDLTDAGWRPGGSPLALSLRAVGSVVINGLVSDGFVNGGQGTDLLDQSSASIAIVAGTRAAFTGGSARFLGADPLETAPGAAADLTVRGDGTVRTGAAGIDLAASRDIVFAAAGDSVYTGGRTAAGAVTYYDEQGNVRSTYPDGSGAVTLTAGRDVIGTLPKTPIVSWLPRVGDAGSTLSWGIDFDNFNWNVGSLGGGSVRVTAGRDVANLSAAAASSGLLNAERGRPTILPGGSLGLRAGRNVNTGLFFVANGQGDLRADGGFGTALPLGNPNARGTMFALGDARVALTSRLGVQLEPIAHPSLYADDALGAVGAPTPEFFLYGPTSGVDVTAVAGNLVTYSGGANGARTVGFFGPTFLSGIDQNVFQMYPASLTLHALAGDILWSGATTLFPSPVGRLDLLASGDINFGVASSVVLSNVSPGAPASSAAPDLNGGALLPLLPLGSPAAAVHLHGDQGPALLTAGRDLTAAAGTAFVSLATPGRLVAGRDILNLGIDAENLSVASDTVVSAGRDFIVAPGVVNASLAVGGPGRLDVIAGRQVDLGFGRGIATTGGLADAALPAGAGADITVIAGLGQPLAGAQFVHDVVASDAHLRDDLVKFVAEQTGTTGLSYDSAVTLFAGLSADEQRPFIVSSFFKTLLVSGREATDATLRPNPGFAHGYAAIDALFPSSRVPTGASSPYAGDISLTFSRIYTLAGGSISLLAPGGLLNVGLAVPPPSLSSRPPSQLGIVTERAGDVNVYTSGDVLVNASRVFTLGGGNILVWSTLGNIDAGRGAKTALSAPPPVVQVDTDGNVTLDYSATVAGSGIRTISPTADLTAGNVDLIAPAGFVNAGDAGIGAAGNLNIAAQQVLGLGNIQVGGSSTGVPAETSSLGASLSAASTSGSSASNAGANAAAAGGATKDGAAAGQSALNWLDVFVTGLGEESCKPDDLECLRRQKHN